jgi:tetratricopeptide (TPR) repeat protein
LRFSGKPESAVSILEQAYRLNPNNTESAVHLGGALLDLGQPAQALIWLDRVLSRTPDHYWVHRMRGQALLSLNRYADAVPALERAWQLGQNNPDVLSWLGDAHCGRGDAEAARTAWRQYLERAPQGPLADQVRSKMAANCLPSAE